MISPVDIQQEIILSALEGWLPADDQVAALFGGDTIIARAVRFDPFEATSDGESATVSIEASGIPVLAVYQSGAPTWKGSGQMPGLTRPFVVEWVGYMPTAPPDDGRYMRDEDVAVSVANVIGCRIAWCLTQEDPPVHAGLPQTALYGDWLGEISITSIQPGVARQMGMFGVSVGIDVWHEASVGPTWIADRSTPLTLVTTEQRHDLGGGEVEHDSEHTITT